MAFILEGSQPSMQLENELFGVPTSLTDRWRTEHEKVNPVTVMNEDGASGDINFQIPASSNGLLSLADIYLEIEVAIKYKKAGDKTWEFITDAQNVAPVNNFIHSLFSAVHVKAAGRLISDPGTYYAHRAYFDSILNTTSQARATQLTSSGFVLDDAPTYFALTTATDAERKRKKWFLNGFTQLSGRLCVDLFEQSKPLITGIPINIRLMMNKPEFFLRSWDAAAADVQYRAHIRNPRLCIRRYIPSPDYMLAVTNKLQHVSCKYHIERVLMRIFDLPKDLSHTTVPNLQIGQLPKIMYVGFIKSEDFQGNIKRSPFEFQHCSITQISVEVDGQGYPTKPYQPEFEKGRSIECYDGLLDVLGRRGSPTGELPFDRDGYCNGYTIFGFDLTPGGTGRGPLSLIKQGNLSVTVTFGKKLDVPMTMVCYMVYDSLLEFNHMRQLIADF